jgi:ATP-dependent RNA helicase DOB1
MKAKLSELVAEYKSINIPLEDKLEKKNKYLDQQLKIKAEINKIVCQPENIVPFLVPGRLIKIKSDDVDWGWGILVSWTK